MKERYKKGKGNNSGFTLVEILVVLFIITFGLLGVTSLVNQNIQVEYVNKNTIIATVLAQEGLELVRNKRDDNWLEGGNWIYSSSTGSRLDVFQDGTYTIDHTGAINAGPNTIADMRTKLYLDNQGFFTHSQTATSTVFSRLITIDNVTAYSFKATCLVRWQRGKDIHDYFVSTLLYDWK
jgi:prepilin-type N-terminal cleavage/methylation domain-containing protein